MADILIRGMEMPKDCGSCVFCENEMFQKYCPLSDNYYDWDESSTGNRPSDCPLIPLPEGHGRLIDADALDRAFTDLRFNSDGTLNHWGDRPGWCMHGYEVEKLIADAPTIVPAEGGTDECSEN